MPYAEYTVRLEAFEGPLDLLLFLIRRAEVEVSDIPIATITDQYLKHIEQLGLGTAESGAAPARPSGERLDIERAGEFLVMAATLMEIKSRMLAPIRIAEDGSGVSESSELGSGNRARSVDPRAELVEQLLEYKRFRDASSQLEQYREQWHARYPSGRALAPKDEAPIVEPAVVEEAQEPAPVEIDDLTLVDLVETFAKIIESVDFTRVGEHRVLMDDTPVEVHAEAIIERLRGTAGLGARADGLVAGELPFVELFEGRTRPEMIGLFLALLELVKQQRIALRQEEQDASGRRIVVRLAEGEAAADAGLPSTDLQAKG